MATTAQRVRLLTLAGAVAVLAACTGGAPDEGREVSGPLNAPAGTPVATAPPGASVAPAPTAPPEAPITPPEDAPLALAAHPSRGPIDVPAAVARAVVSGTARDWSRLGLAPGRLRVVRGPGVDAPRAARAASDAAAVRQAAGDPSVLALVPTSALGPTVRAVLVGGRSAAAGAPGISAEDLGRGAVRRRDGHRGR
ncbi:hypothetical protein [Motilibacter aurantiacus]|uniref:hypothetical protein n=1 Tax=Motilibacter aurantiacus TaxID=2714955 RepID=UPI0014082FD2|nr:hypothetical protein [Motilibacter aurantiacus]NHC43985.1 hypothetical protein [Motilibacter aurantiacus]